MKAIIPIEEVCKPIVAYAHARKKVHYSCTALIVVFELCMALLIHDVFLHVMAITGIGAWETLVISIGELD